MTREYSNKLLELVADGILNKDQVIRDLIMWLSESDVKEYYLKIDLEIEEEDND